MRVRCCCRSKSNPKRCFILLGIPVEAEPRRSAARVPGNRLGRWAEGGRAAARAAAAEGTHRSSGADPGWGTRGAPGSGTPGSLEGTGPRTLAAGACLDRSSEDNLAVRFGGEREAKRERRRRGEAEARVSRGDLEGEAAREAAPPSSHFSYPYPGCCCWVRPPQHIWKQARARPPRQRISQQSTSAPFPMVVSGFAVLYVLFFVRARRGRRPRR